MGVTDRNQAKSCMKTTTRFVWSVLLSILFAGIGTAGYMLIEGWNAIDALFMTITTLATVGYGEVHPLSTPGRIFSMALIVLGVGFFFYVAAAVIQFMVEGRILLLLGRRKLDRKIDRLKNHYIICGYGRIGKVICDKLRRENFDLVVIDKNPEFIDTFESKKMVYLCANAGEEAVLLKAGLQRAKGRLLPFGLAHILREKRSTRWVAINGAGILPEFQGRGGNALLYSEMEKTIKEFSFKNAVLVLVAESAVDMRNDLENIGGKPYTNHRVYHKKL